MLDDFAKALAMEEKQFEKVKKYLEDHPGETLEQVADHTDVRDKTLLKWIDQGRIQLGGASTSNQDSRAQLAEEFRKAQAGMSSGGSRFEQASRNKSMHTVNKKK